VAVIDAVQADDGLRVADVDGKQHYEATSMSSPMSSTGAELVMAPTEMQSTPVRAYAPAVSRVIPPLTSSSGRLAPLSFASSTALRTSSGVMLSSSSASAPASNA